MVAIDRELAYNATMNQIAATQAAWGDIQGAKRTAWQIVDQCEGKRGPAEVVAVRFYCGHPVYYRVPPCPDYEPIETPPPRMIPAPPPPQPQAARQRPIQPASYETPVKDFAPLYGPLPVGYFAADPRHGRLVDFVDDRDSAGTRITLRTYADGFSVIETPRLATVAAK